MMIKRSVVFPILLVLAALAFASVALAETDFDFLAFENTRDPEQKYKECLERCERRHEGQSFQERCHDDCKVRRKQTEERREQERGGDRGRHEEQKRREEERAREEEEERRREREKGGGGRGREKQQRREEQQREEERRREHQKGGGGRGREEQQREEEQRQEEERRREHQKGGGGRGREEQQREEERREEQRQEEERRREHQKGGGGRGREEQQREEERHREHEKGSRRGREEQRGQQEKAREEEERARKQEEQQEEEERRAPQKGRERQRREKEGDNLIKEVTSRDPEYSRERRQEKEEEGEKNPFVFKDQHFRTIIQTQHGRERVLPKFTERSKLFKGIENYRLLIIEAEPQTFILPKHYDADTVFFVAQGKGTVSIVRQNKRESFNIKRGDVSVLPSGIPVYVTNPSSNEKLVVVKLLRPVNTPGRFEYFFGAGGEEPESFYRAFSTDILEAAFNTRRDKFEKIFGHQRQGEIVKASEEQIKRLSQHEEHGGIWPFGGESKSSIVNIFKQQPIQSNQYGQLYEVDGSKLSQLQDYDVSVSVANISQGSMSTVLYNSRATKIAIVLNGEGYFEMACPHLSQSGQQGSSPSYQKVSARLKRGVAVVIPAGHPHVVLASENQNLEIVSFEINANNNERFPLAGRANVINQFERTAKELAFGVPAGEVDDVFRSQKEDFFFKGPSQKQRRGQGA